MRTVLVTVFLCVVCQAHVHEGPPPLSIDRQLVDMLRKAISKKDPNSGLSPIPSATTPDFNSPASPPQDYGWIKDEFEGLEETLLFPGSHYLVELIRQYCESNGGLELMEVADIQDDFELPDCKLVDIGRNTFKVSKLVKDPESVALLATRRVLGPIFQERMRCPATILDISLVRVVMAKKSDYMRGEDESLYTLFKNMAPLIHPVLAPYADDIAARGVALFHGKVFNETIDFIFAYGLKDVAFASHSIFKGLREFFRNPDSNKHNRESDFKNRIEDNVRQVKCANADQLAENHKKIVWRFRDEFGGIETARVCTGAKLFLNQYVSFMLPGVVVDFEENSNLQIVCEKVRDHVLELVAGYGKYESFLYSMNIRELEELIRQLMTNAEWTLVKEAVSRLGFSVIR